MGRYIGALRQFRWVLVAVFTGLVGATAQPDDSPRPPPVSPSGAQAHIDLAAGLRVAEALPLLPRPGGPAAVSVHLKTSGPAQGPVSLWQAAAWWRHDQLVPAMRGLYVGLLVGLFLYNLWLCFTLRERVYLHNIVLVAFIGLFQSGHTGLGTQPVWPDWGAWSAQVQAISLALAGIVSLMFARSFLAPVAWAPPLDLAVRALMGLWLVALVAVPWLGVPMTATAVILPGLLTLSILLGGAVRAFRVRHPGAGSLTLAWAALLAGALALVLVRAGALPPHPVLVHAFTAGSAMAMVLLSLALAHRIKRARAARDDALALAVRQQVEKEAAERAARDRSRFLVAVSHDLRQPLYAMTLATESMARQRPLRHPGPLLAQMRAALESADVLLDALHTIARLETGALRPRIIDFSVQPMLERLDHLYGPQARSRELRWTVTPSIARVSSDPVLLERMLADLVTHALRFTERGGVVVACRPRGDHILMQVWDTGKGLSCDDRQSLSGTLTGALPDSDTGHGVGLGLAMVRQCAGLLGIDLSVRSRPGRGSCISLRVRSAAPARATA